MKKFLLTIICFLALPVILIAVLFVFSDPFRTLHPFDPADTSDVNREYVSTELFLRNYSAYHYDSYVLGSSRCCGINTYTWQLYIGQDSRPYLFQSWSETLTGICLKLRYLDRMGSDINHALILLDIPGAFRSDQLPKESLSMKHYIFTGRSRFAYNSRHFFNYLQSPDLWLSSFSDRIRGTKIPLHSDSVSNAYSRDYAAHFSQLPEPDSLNGLSPRSRDLFMQQIQGLDSMPMAVSEPLISESIKEMLLQMKSILASHHTDYRIVVSPAYYATHSCIAPQDLQVLQDIFGFEYVFDFSGFNDLTDDFNLYSDPNHFGERVGFLMLQRLYPLLDD